MFIPAKIVIAIKPTSLVTATIKEKCQIVANYQDVLIITVIVTVTGVKYYCYYSKQKVLNNLDLIMMPY